MGLVPVPFYKWTIIGLLLDICIDRMSSSELWKHLIEAASRVPCQLQSLVLNALHGTGALIDCVEIPPSHTVSNPFATCHLKDRLIHTRHCVHWKFEFEFDGIGIVDLLYLQQSHRVSTINTLKLPVFHSLWCLCDAWTFWKLSSVQTHSISTWTNTERFCIKRTRCNGLFGDHSLWQCSF